MGMLPLAARLRGRLAAGRDAAVGALAGFGGANLLLGLLGGPNRNDIWVRGPAALAVVTHLAVGALALGFLFRWTRLARRAAVVLALLAAFDTTTYLTLLHRESLAGGAPMPLSLLVALLLASWTRRAERRPRARRRLVVVGATGVGMVLLHLMAFGATDYRRPADAAVVFGAAVSPDGSPSGVLRDRTWTACRLYHAGLVDTLVLSGGRNPAVPISEPECMARIARAAGVPADALVLDETGLNSAASLAAVDELARNEGWSRVLLVSHDYHLARLHLLSRTMGVRTFTVPAVETVDWPSKPICVMREIAAWCWHFARTSRGST